MGWRRLAAGTAVAAILGVAGGPAAGAGTSGTVETPALRGVDAAVQRGLEEKAYPGAVLIIGQPGRILWAKAYGRHTFEPDSRPMTLDTIFDLASVSKVVGTATVAMGLIEEGKLGLDDRVSSHLPIFGTGGKEEVTVRDLRALGWDIYTTAPYCTRFNQTDETRVIGHTGFTGTLILLDKLSRTYAVFLTNRVWPDEPEPSARIVSRVRREIWDTVLRALPEYRSWFKETDGQGGRRGRGGSRRAERNNGPR